MNCCDDDEAQDTAEADTLLPTFDDLSRIGRGLLPLALCWIALVVWLVWARWS